MSKIYRGRRFSGGLWPISYEVKAVDQVSLELYLAECLGLVGESGCGKSTLARCIAGIERFDSGSVELQGKALTEARGAELRHHRRRLQLVFQDPASALDPRLTVSQSLSDALDPGQRSAESVAELLASVELLPEYSDRYPHQLSGGQRQRVTIARALATEPEVLLLDEPVSALDATVRRRILDLLRQLRRQRDLSMILIGHDLTVVEDLADRVAVLYLGRVVEVGEPATVFARPRHPYSALLASSRLSLDPQDPDWQGSLSQDQGEPPSPENPPSGCAFNPRCPRATEKCRRVAPVLVGSNTAAVACHHPIE